MPACAQMKASLAHSTVVMLADSSAPKPARSQHASRRLARWLARPSSSPNVMLAGPPACTITPARRSQHDERGPAHHMAVPYRPGELLFVLDPVLQRHH